MKNKIFSGPVRTFFSLVLPFFSFFILLSGLPVHAVENVFFIDQSSCPLSGPSTMIMLDDGMSCAVINRISGKISKIKHDTVVFERAIENCKPFYLLAVNNEIFVSCKECGEVKVLSQADFSLKKTIPIGETATFMALSSDKNKIYVSCPHDGAETIAMIDVNSKMVISPPVYDTDLKIVGRLFAHKGKLYAASLQTSVIVVFNEETLEKETSHPFGIIPDDILVTDTFLYLSSSDEGKITIVDLDSFDKVKDIEFDGRPGRMIFDGNRYIYVLNSDRTGKVLRLDTETHEFDRDECFDTGNCFYTGARPEDGVIARDGKVMYVSNYGDNTITYHFISGKLFVEPRTVIVKPAAYDENESGNGMAPSQNGITLKAGGGSGKYNWSAQYGELSAFSGEQVLFFPPQDEDIYYVTVEDETSGAAAQSKIFVVDIRVSPDHRTVSRQETVIFDITGGTPPYAVEALQGGSVMHSNGETPFTYGDTSFSFLPPQSDGIYTIEITDKNSAKGYATVEMAGIPPLPEDASRAAIIVAGGPPTDLDAKNNIWSQIKYAAETLYDTLITKGFSQEQIYLLAPVELDINRDGSTDQGIIRNKSTSDDSVQPLLKTHVKEAFKWAQSAADLDQPLFAFFLGHGNEDVFKLERVSRSEETRLGAEDLHGYIDAYQKASGNKIVVVMDSCHSGSFIDDLSAPDRAVITSTGADNVAYYSMYDKTTLHAFIWHFSQNLLGGCNLKAAYENACDELKKFHSSALCEHDQYFFQNPQYDDNGDSSPTDRIQEIDSGDGAMLKLIDINRSIQDAFQLTAEVPVTSDPAKSDSLKSDPVKSDPVKLEKNYFADVKDEAVDKETSKETDFQAADTLSIVSLNGSSAETYSIGEPVSLQAKVGIARGSVQDVYGVLKPPGMKLSNKESGDGVTSEPPVLSYPLIKLAKTDIDNPESTTGEIWKAQWAGAVYRGCYEIIFFARTQSGGFAFSAPFKFGVSDGTEPPDETNIDIIISKNETDTFTFSSSSKQSPPSQLPDFSQGDVVSIGVTEHLSWGYDLYIAIVLPGGEFLVFSGKDSVSGVPLLKSEIVKWSSERFQEEEMTLISFSVPQGMPAGEYLVFAVMVPQGMDVLRGADSMKLCNASFIIR